MPAAQNRAMAIAKLSGKSCSAALPVRGSSNPSQRSIERRLGNGPHDLALSHMLLNVMQKDGEKAHSGESSSEPVGTKPTSPGS